MNDPDASALGQQAERALTDFLRPAFMAVEADYATRLTDLAAEKPWEADKITKLATALKIARTVRQQVEALVADGKHADANMQRAAQIERIPTHKRSILGL